MSHTPRPLRAKFWTPGVVLMAFLMAAGAVASPWPTIGSTGPIGLVFGYPLDSPKIGVNLSLAHKWVPACDRSFRFYLSLRK